MSVDLARHVPPALRSGIRRVASRAGLAISRHPFPRRVVRLANLVGVTTILDIGANSGQYAALMRESGFPGGLVSVEPLSGPFGDLRRRSRDDRSWSALRVAVGDREGEVEINIAGNAGASSSVLDMLPVHEQAAPDSRYQGKEVVRMTTLDALSADLRLPLRHTLVKIDVPGYEAQVLAGAAESLSSITAVQVELTLVELYAGQRLMDDVVETLTDRGFTLWALEPGFSDPRTGRLLQCDGLFVREESIP
ncbi:FkbM family methyltransferase [Saccharothrix violaceirubra]|uniref:FkbM family methyltransferase n=1 Tax=Saccharothrix violaceirubra TaxID=413306 RepID=A0A7W7SYN1_9PSEU|nr:FkbM family methyltransferase [Saccharothrix violaceirubra]MBB4963369.1 FkbM family methyltransferase [Saccharothrix violaceirubra]